MVVDTQEEIRITDANGNPYYRYRIVYYYCHKTCRLDSLVNSLMSGSFFLINVPGYFVLSFFLGDLPDCSVMTHGSGYDQECSTTPTPNVSYDAPSP